MLKRLPKWVYGFFWADVIFVQESLLLWPLLYFKRVGKNRRIIFDFSDPVDHAGPGLKGRLRKAMFGKMTQNADALMFENRIYESRLGELGKPLWHFYGPVDARRYKEARSELETLETFDSPVKLLWTGSPGTFEFIRPLLPIIDRIAAERPLELILIGVESAMFSFKHAKVTVHRWEEETEFSLVAKGTLGLFRLPEDDSALLRGAGKLFIYLAAGVIPVATNRGISRDVMNESGIGFAVDDAADWSDTLQKAINSVATMQPTSRSAQNFALEHLSYEAYRTQLALLFTAVA
jgi:glycosyltransferase involved in cell wall biosynthesis